MTRSSDAEKAELDGVRVIHSWELSQQKHGRTATPEEIADAPPMSHPLVRLHPDSGRKCLFMGVHASHFEGRPMAEGRARLAALEAHATQPRFMYRHTWRAGDMLMWDNRSLLHRADANFDAARFPRVLHRTCLRGSAPAYAATRKRLSFRRPDSVFPPRLLSGSPPISAATSSGVSFTRSAPTFSSSRCLYRVPGMATTSGPCASNHASVS